MKEKIVIAVLMIIVLIIVSFFCTAGLVKLACWAFGYMFTWKLAVGIWAVLWLLEVRVSR